MRKPLGLVTIHAEITVTVYPNFLGVVMAIEERIGYFCGGEYEQEPTCKYCGSHAVYWADAGPRWVLFNDFNDEPHVCNPPTPDDFEDLTDAD
jgi:hypothetical protein